MNFEHPVFLLALIPFVFLLFFKREKKYLGYSSVSHLKGTASMKMFLLHVPRYLCFFSIVFATIAFSKPQSDYYETETTFQGREIMLSIDTSFSMTGEAMEKIKDISKDFIKQRSNDMIGITIYGTDAALIVLPTWETPLLDKSLDRIQPQLVGVRTAIGEGVFTSILALVESDLGQSYEINKIRNSINKVNGLGEYAIDFIKMVEKKGTMKNKVIVLFTDGIYNVGMDPVRPLRFASRLGIKTYVISVPASGETGVEYEQAEERIASLKKGVESTGGKYFEAENYEEVEEFYGEINRIEKDRIVAEQVLKKKDLFFFPTVVSICFLFGTVLFENIWLKFP
ncbi:MAG: VWA domain-containing protein [Candidatus Scalindua sp.]|nr:VWA domain-containing protein [Candidatus Scalindua sp.]